jgi:hypothetical protein
LTSEEEKRRVERKSRFQKELTNSGLTIIKRGQHITAPNNFDDEDLNFELLCEKWKIKVHIFK